MAVLACVGAGDLMSATAYGEQHRTLAFLREQRDLAIEPTLLPDALAGRRTAAVTTGELFLEDWIAAGRRPAPGRAIGPCAVAMALDCSAGTRSVSAGWASWPRSAASSVPRRPTQLGTANCARRSCC